MLKFVYICLVAVFFSACGVDTSSSPVVTDIVVSDPIESDLDPIDSNPIGSNPIDSNLIDSNPIDSNPDDNTTDPDDNTTDPDDNTTEPEPEPDPDIDTDFETAGAIEDEQACLSSNGYIISTDNSMNPEGYLNVVNAIKITSNYPFNASPVESTVMLFHPVLTQSKLNVFTNIATSTYQVSFDNSWVNNNNRVVYVRTPLDENEKYRCYKYDLNSTNSSSIDEIKVYRINK